MMGGPRLPHPWGAMMRWLSSHTPLSFDPRHWFIAFSILVVGCGPAAATAMVSVDDFLSAGVVNVFNRDFYDVAVTCLFDDGTSFGGDWACSHHLFFHDSNSSTKPKDYFFNPTGFIYVTSISNVPIEAEVALAYFTEVRVSVSDPSIESRHRSGRWRWVLCRPE